MRFRLLRLQRGTSWVSWVITSQNRAETLDQAVQLAARAAAHQRSVALEESCCSPEKPEESPRKRGSTSLGGLDHRGRGYGPELDFGCYSFLLCLGLGSSASQSSGGRGGRICKDTGRAEAIGPVWRSAVDVFCCCMTLMG